MPQIPPGRAGVLWLGRRLTVAERGTRLLRQKLTLLTDLTQRLRTQHDAAAHDWQSVDRQARRWLLRAAMLGGERALRLATGGEPLTVEQHWTTTMGVRYPVQPTVRVAQPPASGTAIGRAQRLYADAAVAAARYAAALAALGAVEAETTATRRQLRALERHWIPRLGAALAATQLQLAEAEAADAVHRRRAAAATPH